MKTQWTREVWWTHNKRGEVTTWAWISKPISPGEKLLNINKSSEENDTYLIPWKMLTVENNINHYLTLQLQHLPWIELEKTPSDLIYISHQLLLYISSHAMQNKTPESPFNDLVSPVSLSKKNGDVMQQLNVFFPRNFSPVFLGQLHCLLRSQIQCIAGCTQQGHCIQTQGTWKQLLKGLENQHKNNPKHTWYRLHPPKLI